MTEVYCITGYPGSGKGVFADIAREKSVPVISMGDQVRARAPESIQSSDSIGDWATSQREKHGDDIVAQWTVEDVKEMEEEIVVIEGVRSLDEFERFKSEFEDFHLVFISASKETRLSRLQERGREDEGGFTLYELGKRDKREEMWGLKQLVREGDYIEIENESSLDEFRSQSKELLED